MVAVEVKERQNRERILSGYRKALRTHNMHAVTSIREKHSQYLIAFTEIEIEFSKEQEGK